MKKHWIITIVLVIVVGVGAFFGGMQYQRMQRSIFFTQGGQNGGGRFYARFGNGGQNGNVRPVRGQIISSDSNSITVKMPDGSSIIVILSGSTSITKSAPATKDDLTKGQEVVVLGTSNSDGSVTAQTIQLNPQMEMRGITPQPTK
ncbi:MAG TPA: DUF5666 domain-containing protein [Patescibacteria group bacterium]